MFIEEYEKHLSIFILNKKYEIIEISEGAQLRFPTFCHPLFFKNILSPYPLSKFEKSLILTVSTYIENNINLVFSPFVDGMIKCQVMIAEDYSSFSGHSGLHFQLREPVSSIFALLPLTASYIKKDKDAQAIENLNAIYQKSYFLLRTINNISLAAKILSGHILEKKNIDLSSLIKNMTESIKEVIPNTKISAYIDPGVTIMANANFVSTAFANLFSNSLKYKSENPLEIEIELRHNDKTCTLKYCDNSIGISDDILPFIFKPYFSKDIDAESDDAPSLGLGLFILKSSIEQANGNIFVISQLGEGVKYSISAPITLPEPNEILESAPNDYAINKFSDIFVQLCEFCELPTLL